MGIWTTLPPHPLPSARGLDRDRERLEFWQVESARCWPWGFCSKAFWAVHPFKFLLGRPTFTSPSPFSFLLKALFLKGKKARGGAKFSFSVSPSFKALCDAQLGFSPCRHDVTRPQVSRSSQVFKDHPQITYIKRCLKFWIRRKW